MVLPDQMTEIFKSIRADYSQTCSKTEQLALAFYMEDGKYQTHIKKVRRLYSQKLQTVLTILESDAKDFITPINTSSGINMILSVKSNKDSKELISEANNIGLHIISARAYTENSDDRSMIFYYNQVPLKDLSNRVKALIKKWRN